MVRVSPKELEKWLKDRTLKESNSHTPNKAQSPRTDSSFDEFIKGLKQGEWGIGTLISRNLTHMI
jgi:hypothetical protein